MVFLLHTLCSPPQSAAVTVMLIAAILTRASGWHRESGPEVSVTTAGITRRATGAKGASLVFTGTEENPCLPQRFVNVSLSHFVSRLPKVYTDKCILNVCFFLRRAEIKYPHLSLKRSKLTQGT